MDLKKIISLISFTLLISCKSTIPKNENSILKKSSLDNFDISNLYEDNIKLEKSNYIPFVNNNPNRFSIVIIPDTQGYTSTTSNFSMDINYPLNNIEALNKQLEFITTNSSLNGGDFSFAAQVGDLVNWPTKHKKEWKVAANSMKILVDKIPYIIVPGNHDYDFWYKGAVHGLTYYKKYFGSKSKFYKNKTFFGGKNPKGHDIYCYFEACNYKFLVIGLEFEPSDKSLLWAQRIINENKDLPTIIVTHGYIEQNLENKMSIYTTKSYRNSSKFNLGEQVWEKLIQHNDQIFLVLCGHEFQGNNGSGVRIDKNTNGNTTYSILSNYQGRVDNAKYYGYDNTKSEFGGDGWLTTLNFDLDEKKIYIKTFSTEFNCYETDAKSDYVLPIDWEWSNRFIKKEIQ